MASKFCVKFQRKPLTFHTKFWTHTPQNIQFTNLFLLCDLRYLGIVTSQALVRRPLDDLTPSGLPSLWPLYLRVEIWLAEISVYRWSTHQQMYPYPTFNAFSIPPIVLYADEQSRHIPPRSCDNIHSTWNYWGKSLGVGEKFPSCNKWYTWLLCYQVGFQ